MKVDRVSVEANWKFGNGITFRSLSSNIEMNRLQNEAGNSLVYASQTGFQLGPGMRTWSQEFNLDLARGPAVRVAGRPVPQQSAHRVAPEYSAARPVRLGIQRVPGRLVPPQFVPAINRLQWFSLDDVIHTAAYGQLNFHISDALEFTLEARENQDDNTQKRATFFLPGHRHASAGIRCPARATSKTRSTIARNRVFRIRTGRRDSLLDWKGNIRPTRSG